ELNLVRQTDRDQGTAGTLRTVDQRFRDAATGRHCAQRGDRIACQGKQFLIERNRYAFLAGDVVDRALFANVTVLAKEQTLRTDLHALRIIDAARDVRPLAALVVDGHDGSALAFD